MVFFTIRLYFLKLKREAETHVVNQGKYLSKIYTKISHNSKFITKGTKVISFDPDLDTTLMGNSTSNNMSKQVGLKNLPVIVKLKSVKKLKKQRNCQY